MTDEQFRPSEIPAVEGFGVEALPYGVCLRGDHLHVCVRLGDHLVDLAVLDEAGLLESPFDQEALHGSLDTILAASPEDWALLRDAITTLIVEDAVLPMKAVKPLDIATMVMPFSVADYVDFYSSVHHATNLGKLFRPDDDPIMANWLRLPVGYHGRAGTVVDSGTPIVRPKGLRPNPDGEPSYGPSRRLDIELEVGFVVGNPTDLGTTVEVDNADQHVFGVVLLNDWSARDIQAYEYKPLGPFLGKSFATSISHWVLPLAALTDALVPQPMQDPAPQPYLQASRDWALALELEVHLETAAMRAASDAPVQVSAGGFDDMYWTFAQQLAHMTANGASLRPGDLYASGTVSGPDVGTEGSFIELSWNGQRPIALPGGEERTFLEDGDRIVLRAMAPGPNGSHVALGEVDGTILPATS
ncbi:MAG: fumarylacetoacetase [Glaciecola sp.]|jgi:fumarylacetoacetase